MIPSALRPRRTGAPLDRGYTVVEVLLAMTVLIIGASGVMSMQKASMQGNLDARKTDIATNIARMWMERIQKDAMGWTLPSPSFPASANNVGNARLLGTVNNTWFLPTNYLPATAPYASISPGYDMLGRDIPSLAGLPQAVFCVHLRENYLVNNAATPTDSLIRVELRVVWPRGINLTTYAPPLCDATSAQTLNPDPSLYSTLYMVTAVRANGIQ